MHEAYLRLVGARESQMWDSRGYFICAAAEAMRRILVESARRKKRRKHGGQMERVALADIDLPLPLPYDQLLALDEGLVRLAAVDSACRTDGQPLLFCRLNPGTGRTGTRSFDCHCAADLGLRSRLAGPGTSGPGGKRGCRKVSAQPSDGPLALSRAPKSANLMGFHGRNRMTS